MSLNPTQQFAGTFVSDGVATVLEIDLSLAPFNVDFRGNIPLAVMTPQVSSAFTGPIANVTAELAGTIVTLTFSAAPPQVDNNMNLIEYSYSFYIKFPA